MSGQRELLVETARPSELAEAIGKAITDGVTTRLIARDGRRVAAVIPATVDVDRDALIHDAAWISACSVFRNAAQKTAAGLIHSPGQEAARIFLDEMTGLADTLIAEHTRG